MEVSNHLGRMIDASGRPSWSSQVLRRTVRLRFEDFSEGRKSVWEGRTVSSPTAMASRTWNGLLLGDPVQLRYEKVVSHISYYILTPSLLAHSWTTWR